MWVFLLSEEAHSITEVTMSSQEVTRWVTRGTAGINNNSKLQRTKLVEYEEHRQHFDLLNKAHVYGAC